MSLTARSYGMSGSQLSRLLNGENCPSMNSLRILSEILHIPVEKVMSMYQKQPDPKRLAPEARPKGEV